MDTSTWTVEDHIAWIRQYARDAKSMAEAVVGWQLDVLGTHAGTVEVIDWPDHDQPKPEDSRVIHAGGFAYLVRDVK